MLTKFIDSLNTILYVQIWENRIKVTNILTGDIFDEKPLIAISIDKKGQKFIVAVGNNSFLSSGANIAIINPFSHIRSLIANFEIGERLLQYIFSMLLKGCVLKLRPKVVVHPMEKIEGGLTDVEERAFKELAICAGARDVVVYQGSELVISQSL